MRQLVTIAILFWVSLAPKTAAAVESLRVGFDVMSFGSLQVDVPEGWTVTGESTYRFRSVNAAEFVLLVTPLPAMKSKSAEELCRHALQTAEATRTELRAIAAEAEIPIRKMDDQEGCVRYVSVTDKTVTKPTTEDFKYGVQGAAGIGRVLVSFTILTNTKDSVEVQTALDMILRSKHIGGPADPGSTAAAATHLSYPGKGWSLVLDLSGLEIDPPAVDEEGTGLKFSASREEPNLVMSIFFEPADRGDDPRIYRADYREKAFKAAPFKREDVRESGGDEMPLLWYTNVVGELRHHNVNAFMVRDGLWIDVHLSSVRPIKESRRLFDGFLGAMRFTENKVARP